MIDSIINFLLSVWRHLVPFFVVDEFEEGVVLRLGKFNRVVKKGLHWKWWAIEDVMLETVVTTTMDIEPQSLTTLDLKEIVIKSVVKYHITDIKKFLLDVTDVFDAIQDSIQSVLANLIVENTYNDLITTDVLTQAKDTLQDIVGKWGIEVENVTITDFTKSPTIRIMGID